MEYIRKVYKTNKGETCELPRAGIQPHVLKKLPMGKNILKPLGVYLLLCECSDRNGVVNNMTEQAIASHLKVSVDTIEGCIKKLIGWGMIKKVTVRGHYENGTLVKTVNTYTVFEVKNKSSCLYWQLREDYNKCDNKAEAMALYALMRSKLEDLPELRVSIADLKEISGAGHNLLDKLIGQMTAAHLVARVKSKGAGKSTYYFQKENLYDIETLAEIFKVKKPDITLEEVTKVKGEAVEEEWRKLRKVKEMIGK